MGCNRVSAVRGGKRRGRDGGARGRSGVAGRGRRRTLASPRPAPHHTHSSHTRSRTHARHHTLRTGPDVALRDISSAQDIIKFITLPIIVYYVYFA